MRTGVTLVSIWEQDVLAHQVNAIPISFQTLHNFVRDCCFARAWKASDHNKRHLLQPQIRALVLARNTNIKRLSVRDQNYISKVVLCSVLKAAAWKQDSDCVSAVLCPVRTGQTGTTVAMLHHDASSIHEFSSIHLPVLQSSMRMWCSNAAFGSCETQAVPDPSVFRRMRAEVSSVPLPSSCLPDQDPVDKDHAQRQKVQVSCPQTDLGSHAISGRPSLHQVRAHKPNRDVALMPATSCSCCGRCFADCSVWCTSW
jgi:hypothetical protein